jgi:hypothetical protein
MTMVAVHDQVDAGINACVSHPAEVRNFSVPLRWRIPDQIVAYSALSLHGTRPVGKRCANKSHLDARRRTARRRWNQRRMVTLEQNGHALGVGKKDDIRGSLSPVWLKCQRRVALFLIDGDFYGLCFSVPRTSEGSIFCADSGGGQKKTADRAIDAMIDGRFRMRRSPSNKIYWEASFVM